MKVKFQAWLIYEMNFCGGFYYLFSLYFLSSNIGNYENLNSNKNILWVKFCLMEAEKK